MRASSAKWGERRLHVVCWYGCLEVGVELIEILKRRGETLAVAESCTGGGVARRIAGIAGASAVFVGGIVAYDPRLKVSLLGVDAGLVTSQTIVSAATAQSMACGVRARLGATWGIATTGFAGPTGGSDRYSVGTVALALASCSVMQSRVVHLCGTREEVMDAASDELIRWLEEMCLSS